MTTEADIFKQALLEVLNEAYLIEIAPTWIDVLIDYSYGGRDQPAFTEAVRLLHAEHLLTDVREYEKHWSTLAKSWSREYEK